MGKMIVFPFLSNGIMYMIFFLYVIVIIKTYKDKLYVSEMRQFIVQRMRKLHSLFGLPTLPENDRGKNMLLL